MYCSDLCIGLFDYHTEYLAHQQCSDQEIFIVLHGILDPKHGDYVICIGFAHLHPESGEPTFSFSLQVDSGTPRPHLSFFSIRSVDVEYSFRLQFSMRPVKKESFMSIHPLISI